VISQDEIKAKVLDIVAEKLNKPKDSVTLEMSFVNDLGADSLDQVELIMDFEDAFDLEIPEEAAEKILTVGEAVKYVAEAVAKKEAGGAEIKA
jgi:acyl carrier protein